MSSMIPSDPTNWYAVRVKSNRERVTAEALRGRGVEVCLPVCRPKSASGSTCSRRQTPLFVGYVFSRFDARDRLPILMAPGVVHIVGLGNIPQQIDPAEMSAIFSLLRTRAPMMPCALPALGESVHIHTGPLRGITGTVIAHRGQVRLVVCMSLLQRAVEVDVDPQWLRRELFEV